MNSCCCLLLDCCKVSFCVVGADFVTLVVWLLFFVYSIDAEECRFGGVPNPAFAIDIFDMFLVDVILGDMMTCRGLVVGVMNDDEWRFNGCRFGCLLLLLMLLLLEDDAADGDIRLGSKHCRCKRAEGRRAFASANAAAAAANAAEPSAVFFWCQRCCCCCCCTCCRERGG